MLQKTVAIPSLLGIGHLLTGGFPLSGLPEALHTKFPLLLPCLAPQDILHSARGPGGGYASTSVLQQGPPPWVPALPQCQDALWVEWVG